MQHDPQQQDEMKRIALARFYGLLIAVTIAVVIALVAIGNVPGLQDPQTGRLPEAAARALVILPVSLYTAFILIVVFSNRRSR